MALCQTCHDLPDVRGVVIPSLAIGYLGVSAVEKAVHFVVDPVDPAGGAEIAVTVTVGIDPFVLQEILLCL